VTEHNIPEEWIHFLTIFWSLPSS